MLYSKLLGWERRGLSPSSPEAETSKIYGRRKKMRKKRIKSLFFLLLLTFFFSSCSQKAQLLAEAEKLEHFFGKSEVTIAATDSGLGGLSIMADTLERMRESKIFSNVNFIFFNALFSKEGGYNSLKTHEEKVRIFDSALRSLARNYLPDLILICCNTLSTIYEKTPFSKKTDIPVIGIIEAGTKLIAQSLREEPASKVIIFGTQTTISESSYTEELKKQGFPEGRIITQACPELVEYIEKGSESEETEMLIEAFVAEALEKVGMQETPLYVSLSCTHYGYSLEFWKQAFRSFGFKPIAFLNPNFKMADFLFLPQRQGRFDETKITASAVSMVEISRKKIDSIGTWLKKVSPQTAEALFHYELRENLFEWRKFATSRR